MSFGDPTLIAAFLRGHCYEYCNPGPFKQRMIKGARHSDDAWAKLEAFKSVCAQGCDFGAVTQNQLSGEERAALIAVVNEQHKAATKVLDGGALERDRAARDQFLAKLRQECYDLCSGKYGDNAKPMRMCGDGCDAYFEHLV